MDSINVNTMIVKGSEGYDFTSNHYKICNAAITIVTNIRNYKDGKSNTMIYKGNCQ